ncbi:unnamed protein product (macronuclear) [Paramecium tetraurelia]|uniref:Ubiquitin-like domain-containing protein n=1 Tax=Paramecium tetraurelia TaxID=5888 RepID=A0BB96_PARTE|nr:uncharacterized protein GSPATT00000248001 [Paramecium tetraurelia]CAK55813.1 unnamed protein product [Paramecium tetraurelia]|eukprot:XP_001423211.1 hypothetical protein (macronuclear) [Paramecium tetraurelia strain d4-2]
METQISLKIKTLDNQITTFVVDPNNTVQQLKNVIQTQLNIPFDKQRLIYQGRVLENNKTLQEYKLQNDHVILLPGQPLQEDQIVQNQTQQQQQQQSTQGVNEFPEIDILSNILRTLRQHQYNRQNVRRMVQQQRSNGFHLDKQLSLEGIRQNYQTLKQLLDSQVKPEELKQEDLQGEYVNPFDPKKRKFQVGQWIDVKDTIDQWLEAQVQIVEQNRVFVHYNGWGNRWDEWIDTQSPRIATFRTYTVGSINQEFLSPNPVSDPDCEVEKQEIDMHKFIFDVGHMMNQVTQLLIEFGRFENNKRIAEKQIQLQQQYQQMLMNKNKEQNTQENYMEMMKKEKELSEYEIKSSLIGSQLAPIFDRMGRMMTDMAPHLALMGSKTQRVNNNNQQQLLFQVPVTLTPNEMYQSQQNAPTLHSRLEIISNRLAILRMTEYIQQEDSDDDHITI